MLVGAPGIFVAANATTAPRARLRFFLLVLFAIWHRRLADAMMGFFFEGAHQTYLKRSEYCFSAWVTFYMCGVAETGDFLLLCVCTR